MVKAHIVNCKEAGIRKCPNDDQINELYHHGILGQKWGVRRFQNPDGTLTPEGKSRYAARRNIIRNRPYTDYKNEIVRSLTDKEKDFLGASPHSDWIEKHEEEEVLSENIKSFVTMHGDVPVSFVEIWAGGGKTERSGRMMIATRNDEKFRGKGYGAKTLKEAIRWADQYGYKSLDELELAIRKDNKASRSLAEKYGFDEDKEMKFEDYVFYRRKIKERG